MKHLLYILCLFVLSCDSDGDATACEQIVGEWELINTEFHFIGECDEYENFESEFTQEDIGQVVGSNNTLIISEDMCEDNHFITYYCPHDYCLTFPFTIDENIMTLTIEDVEMHLVSPLEINCFADVTKTYERVN